MIEARPLGYGNPDCGYGRDLCHKAVLSGKRQAFITEMSVKLHIQSRGDVTEVLGDIPLDLMYSIDASPLGSWLNSFPFIT